MQLAEKSLEDALKVDADAAGKGGDDGYDMVRYGLASRPLKSAPAEESEEFRASSSEELKADHERAYKVTYPIAQRGDRRPVDLDFGEY